MGESPRLDSTQFHKLITTLTAISYSVDHNLVAGYTVPLVILLIGQVEFSDTRLLDMRHSNQRHFDWRSTVSPLNYECALAADSCAEIIPIHDKGRV